MLCATNYILRNTPNFCPEEDLAPIRKAQRPLKPLHNVVKVESGSLFGGGGSILDSIFADSAGATGSLGGTQIVAVEVDAGSLLSGLFDVFDAADQGKKPLDLSQPAMFTDTRTGKKYEYDFLTDRFHDEFGHVVDVDEEFLEDDGSWDFAEYGDVSGWLDILKELDVLDAAQPAKKTNKDAKKSTSSTSGSWDSSYSSAASSASTKAKTTKHTHTHTHSHKKVNADYLTAQDAQQMAQMSLSAKKKQDYEHLSLEEMWRDHSIPMTDVAEAIEAELMKDPRLAELVEDAASGNPALLSDDEIIAQEEMMKMALADLFPNTDIDEVLGAIDNTYYGYGETDGLNDRYKDLFAYGDQDFGDFDLTDIVEL